MPLGIACYSKVIHACQCINAYMSVTNKHLVRFFLPAKDGFEYLTRIQACMNLQMNIL